MKNRCMKENKKENGMQKTSEFKKTGNRRKNKRKRQATEGKENEVEIEKSEWKKHKGRDIMSVLSATYCSKRTKAAKNSGNVASDSET